MHVSQLLALTLLLTLLSLRAEAQPASPQKVALISKRFAKAANWPESQDLVDADAPNKRLLRDLPEASANLVNDQADESEDDKTKVSKKDKPDGCFGMKLDRIGAWSGLGC